MLAKDVISRIWLGVALSFITGQLIAPPWLHYTPHTDTYARAKKGGQPCVWESKACFQILAKLDHAEQLLGRSLDTDVRFLCGFQTKHSCASQLTPLDLY